MPFPPIDPTALFQAHVDPYCWRRDWDFSDGAVTGYLFAMPILMAVGLSFVAVYTRDLYMQLLASSYWISAAINTLLQYLFVQPPPHPECLGGYGLPVWAIQLAAHQVILLAWHRSHWSIATGPVTFLRSLILMVLVPLALVISGNATTTQALVSLAVGILSGLLSALYIFGFWLDRLDLLCSSRILRDWLGYRHAITKFYALQQRISKPEEDARAREDSLLVANFFGQVPPSDSAWETNVGNSKRAGAVAPSSVLSVSGIRGKARQRHKRVLWWTHWLF